MSDTELIVFAREPVPGQVKTRLAPYPPDRAADLYSAFVWDLCARFAPDWRITLAGHWDHSARFLERVAHANGIQLVPQGDGDLGARMAGRLKQALEGGAARALLIGTDLPTLPASHLEDAARRLLSCPLVFGPSCDGGYYLVGVSRQALEHWEELAARVFEGISWGAPDVLATTLARLSPFPWALAPAWYDVDTPGDLDLLLTELRHAPSAAPRTRSRLATWGQL